MKRVLLILGCVFCSILGFAQDDMYIIDSLRSTMAKQEGTHRVETMAELAQAMFNVSYDDCISLGEMAIAEAEKLGDEELLSWTHWKIGVCFTNHYDLDLAYEHFEKALELLENKEESKWLMYTLNYKGYVELLMGEMDSALATLQRNLQVSESLGYELNCADLINNMAYIYFQQDHLEEAMDCFQDARRRYGLVQDTLSVAQSDNNISNIYVQWEQFDKAKSVLDEAVPAFLYYEDEGSLAHAYQNIGLIYAIGHVNYDSALYYFQKSVACAVNVGDKLTLIEDEIETANVLNRLGKEKEAMDLYQSALHSSEAIGYSKGMLEAYRHLGIHYNEVGDFTTSAVYLKRCMDLATEKGNQLYYNEVRPYLIVDYAHLGHFAEMKKEIGLFREDYDALIKESNNLSRGLSQLQDDAEDLLSQYESQSVQIQTLQSQRDRYRLAFFGLLAIMLATIVLAVSYKIVRKNKAKSAKS